MAEGVETSRDTRVPVFFLGLLLVLFAIAAVIGGYLDWIWWHPTQGIVVTLVAIGLLAVGAMAMLQRRPLATRVALTAGVLGTGLLAGQLLGPPRPDLVGSEGTMTIRLASPVSVEGSGSALCQVEAGGAQISVTDDSNTRLPLPGVEPPAQPFVSAAIHRGDRWSAGTEAREDTLALVVTVSGAVEDATGGPAELRLESGPDSTLVAEMGEAGGTVSFSDLILVTGDVESVLHAAGEVSGTVEWTCGS